MNRRSLIKTLVLGSGVLYLQNCSWLKGRPGSGTSSAINPTISPIDRSLGDVASRTYFGDDFSKAHSVLWDQSQRQVPPPKEMADVVIVGGGMSGLACAYLLRKHNPVVLEASPHLGGNSKGQSWRGLDYSIGAAYFIKPEKKSPIDNLYEEIGVYDSCKVESEGTPFILNKSIQDDFWSGRHDPKNLVQYQTLKTYFENVNNEVGGESYPSLPYEDRAMEEKIRALDELSFLELLEKKLNAPMSAYIRSAMEHYAWSSLGGSLSEVSAAAGLNFYAAEFGEVGVLPGGNAKIAELLYQKASRRIDAKNFRTQSVVAKIRAHKAGVNVYYVSAQGEVQSIHAKTVVMACPKFVANYMLDLEDERGYAIDDISYRLYLVANVLLAKPHASKFYDAFLVNPTLDYKNAQTASEIQGATDVVSANFAVDEKNRSVLTLYRTFPHEGARSKLIQPESYEIQRKAFERQIVDEIMPTLKMSKDAIVDVRLSRFGHALPLAAKGSYAKKIPELIRQPFQRRVFFVHQDNWLLPAIETCLEEALHFKPLIEKEIKS